ncbi:hypothetical protein ABT354_37125 [Streptomyces sp. NPDC000594]|uniref:hypothetical protein n=1 Tax=Streptomyces sp. NPDC000594 TaxID=3154261 RepID=UPI00331CDF69
MKIRRALALAAATAVVAPAVFLASPATAATAAPSGPSPSASASAPADPAPQNTPGTPDTPGTSDASDTPHTPDTRDATSTSDTSGASDSSDTSDASAQEAPAPGTIGPRPEHDGGEGESCDTYVRESTAIRTELKGLPSRIPAGSDWVDFTFRLTNTADRARTGITVNAEAYTPDHQYETSSRYVTLQARIDGVWRTVDSEDSTFGTAGTLEPGGRAEAELRLRVDATAELGQGTVFSGAFFTEKTDGAIHCESGKSGLTSLTVTAPDRNPGDGEGDGGDGATGGNNGGNGTDATSGGTTTGGSGGSGGAADPQGDRNDTPVPGDLADTGSTAPLPVIGTIGAVAVVLGAGTVIAVRRRRTGGTAA